MAIGSGCAHRAAGADGACSCIVIACAGATRSVRPRDVSLRHTDPDESCVAGLGIGTSCRTWHPHASSFIAIRCLGPTSAGRRGRPPIAVGGRSAGRVRARRHRLRRPVAGRDRLDGRVVDGRAIEREDELAGIGCLLDELGRRNHLAHDPVLWLVADAADREAHRRRDRRRDRDLGDSVGRSLLAQRRVGHLLERCRPHDQLGQRARVDLLDDGRDAAAGNPDRLPGATRNGLRRRWVAGRPVRDRGSLRGGLLGPLDEAHPTTPPRSGTSPTGHQQDSEQQQRRQ